MSLKRFRQWPNKAFFIFAGMTDEYVVEQCRLFIYSIELRQNG